MTRKEFSFPWGIGRLPLVLAAEPAQEVCFRVHVMTSHTPSNSPLLRLVTWCTGGSTSQKRSGMCNARPGPGSSSIQEVPSSTVRLCDAWALKTTQCHAVEKARGLEGKHIGQLASAKRWWNLPQHAGFWTWKDRGDKALTEDEPAPCCLIHRP